VDATFNKPIYLFSNGGKIDITARIERRGGGHDDASKVVCGHELIGL
jgi:hypothetical protein